MLLAAAGFGALDPSRVAAQNWQPLAEIETLGAGTSGAAGVPELRVLGWAALDQPGAGLRLRHGAPGALAQIVLSLTEGPTRLPGYGGQLWPGAPFIRWATALDAQGDSPVLHSGPAPTPPALAGQDIFVQGLVLDGAARGGAALTSGVRIRVGAGSTAARLFSESRPAFDPPGTHPSELAVGDVDGDGRPDLVFPVNTPPRRVGVMRQLADGSLAPQLSSPVTPSVTDLELADLDGDGALDVVEAAGPLLILHGLGNGTFGPATVLPSPTGTVTIVAVGDVTGDGRPDLVAPGWTFHTLGVLPGLEGGGFGEAIILPVNDVELAQGVQLADIDGDGLLDVLIATKQPSLGAGTFLVVLRALGGGAFAAPVSTSVGDKSKPQLAVGDIDGDGTPDALIGSGGKFVLSFHVLLNDGSGAYPSAVLSTIVYPNWISHADLDDISIADMDGDGAGEVILISGLTGMAGSMRHIGGGALEAPMWLGLRAYELAPADMDGDGHADLAFLQEGLAGAAGTDWVAGVGDGTLALLPTVPGFVTSSAATADLDGDGDLDLFGRVLSDHSLEVVLGDGQGGFGPPNVISPGEGGAAYDSVAVGDLDGDGITDLVARVAAGTALWR
ncbi:MAG TPA: FG-GAP-like repeat-containing protein, partial [Planctomycetota bacterium]|nr:FG-GAP-like repeat-containing protein [Planctomycetota bacterium]